MLCLTRRIGESVIIADGKIKVTVVEIDGGKIKLGIEAHQSIPVHRGEVWERIKEISKPE